MRFGALKRNWEGLGRRDPLWAVLTDPDKRGGGWDVKQFFETGVTEMQSVLDRAEALGLMTPRRRALDFGCGVGRLTQALADHFERCDGVDISDAMLREARRYDRHAGRCTYHLNGEPNLALFADGSFDFVYSTLVLQHMEPRYSTAYIRELIRVLAPGGLLVFQVPSQPMTALQPEPESGESAPPRGLTAVSGPLPASAFHARLSIRQASLTMRAGDQAWLNVTVQNASDHVWPALPNAGGRCGINVANHWLDERGGMVERDDTRQPLPHDLPPGAQAEVVLEATAPKFDGDYWIEVDLVQEDVSWFAQRGSTSARVRCHVEGGEANRPAASLPRQATEPSDPPVAFRFRHPRVFQVLRVTGLRDAYWAWRRAVDRVKTARDALLVRVKPPIVNWWKRRRIGPYMEMHCVPHADVVAIVTASGGRLADAEEERTRDFQSYRYWVVKR